MNDGIPLHSAKHTFYPDKKWWEKVILYLKYFFHRPKLSKEALEPADDLPAIDYDFYNLLKDQVDSAPYTGPTVTNAVGEYMEMKKRIPEEEMDEAIERYLKAKENGTLDRDFPRIV